MVGGLKEYKAPDLIRKLAFGYIERSEKGLLDSFRFYSVVKETSRAIERFVRGKDYRLPKRNKELSELLGLIWGSFLSQAYLADEEVSLQRVLASRTAIPFADLVDSVTSRSIEDRNLVRFAEGEEIDLQPMYEIGRYLYLLSRVIQEKSDDPDLRKFAKKAEKSIIEVQKMTGVFDFPIVPYGAEKELEEYLQP